ncbi:hypothetical protein [Ferrovibrio sp.]|uniref:hypothetical protein n=1 Tax=Ferrovibrio sp. TaxID=1917215 RepID=UPI003D2997A3
MPRTVLPGLILSILCLAAVPAARAADWPAVDPPASYRLLGAAQPGQGTGQGAGLGACTATPLCAIETLLACFSRRNEALCRAVWPGAPAGSLFGAEQRHQAYWWSWRVAEVTPLRAGEAEIAIAGRHCGLLSHAEPVCRTTPAPATRYRVVRRSDGLGWQVVDWRSPTEANLN